MIEFLPFTSQLLWLIALLIVLLMASALISGSETAFFSLSPTQLHNLQDEESTQSKAALNLLENQDTLLSTILIINNLVNIGAIIVANSIIEQTLNFGDSTALEFLVKIIIVTFVLLLFGEIMPKILAAYNSYPFAKMMALPMKFLRTVFRPISFLLINSSSFITNSLAHHQSNVSMDELQEAIEITQTETPEDKKMLKGIVRFVNIEVDEIMKPRIDVVTLDIEQGFDSVRATVIESGYSRIPVWQESFDHVKGVLYVKDLLPYIQEPDSFDWQKLLREPYYVPEHKKINDLLEDFQTKKIHLAIVVDEYGGTLGVVSLEDILEEIVGEITDESDKIEKFYTQIDPCTYIFDGKTHLGDFERILHLSDHLLEPLKGDADTLAGLMLEIKGDFFKVNQAVTFDRYTLRAQEIDNYRITKIRVTIADDRA